MQIYFKLLILAFSFVPFHTNAQISTEKKPASLVEKFLSKMGGKELWAQTNALHVKEMMYPKQLAEPILQEVWRDLEKPRTKLRLKNSTMDRVRALNINEGWGLLETGKFYVYDSVRIKNELAGWARDLYVVCRKMALDDSLITYREKEGNIIQVSDEKGQLLCWIELNEAGAPIKWTRKNTAEEESIIYGPLTQFGPYYMPKWWTSTDGHWQYEYLEVTGSPNQLKVSFEVDK